MTLESRQKEGKTLSNEQKEKKESNDLDAHWINVVRFKDKSTHLLFKTGKNKNFINARILIKTNDYKIQDGYVTVTAELTMKGLKDLNIATYNAGKVIKEHMKVKEDKK